MPELKDYNIIVGYEVEASPIEVSTLNKKLTSLFRDSKENINSTPDISCQTVWYTEPDKDHTLNQIGFKEILLIGFNGIGTAEFNNRDNLEMNTYSVPLVLMESTFETIEYEIEETLDIDVERVERVILAPREHGVVF